MVWFRVDDKFHGHRKVRALGRRKLSVRSDVGSIGLWTLTGTWSADHLEDGFVPRHVAEDYDPALTLASHLIRAGLWTEKEKHGEPGFQFVNWEERQPTREKVEARRDADRERLRKWREKQAGNAVTNAVSNDVTESGNAVTHDRVTLPPTRPDPTRPEVLNSSERETSPNGTREPRDESPPTCSRHPTGNPTDEPCAGCARVREHRDEVEARVEADRAAAADRARSRSTFADIERAKRTSAPMPDDVRTQLATRKRTEETTA